MSGCEQQNYEEDAYRGGQGKGGLRSSLRGLLAAWHLELAVAWKACKYCRYTTLVKVYSNYTELDSWQ